MATPTRLMGYVDDSAYGDLLGDVMEHVADLVFPLSVATYHQMRRDPQLAAVLQAYTLLIRRADWALNPAGCRPEVVALCADDLGLPVLGADTPGPARVRAVSWRRHLRAALLNLVYGFMAFEMRADTSTGRARLAALSERMPYTIAEIRVDPTTGDLLGADQNARADLRFGSANPQIPATRLVWYAHDREGAGWQGTSLLRPAFAPWLIKREMLRVHATANRRFGMGVPTVEWESGANPGPAQMSAAQAAASAARVGDTAGMALPPGARLVLTGLTGSAPDTLAFLGWLDQQMSRMALAGHLDLGETSNGSRALGESFIDLMLMAQQSIADDLADEATRQVVARLVGWNFGDDEPVPAVVCGPVGADHEVTAEALRALIETGAISTDPALEAWLRKRYRLPAAPDPGDGPATINQDTAHDLAEMVRKLYLGVGVCISAEEARRILNAGGADLPVEPAEPLPTPDPAPTAAPEQT